MGDESALVSSPVTPTPKGRNLAPGAEDEVTRDASGASSQSKNPYKPPQPDAGTCGSGSHVEDLHQAEAQSHSPDLSKPIPFHIPPSTGQPKGSQDDDPFSDVRLYGAVHIARGDQRAEATGSTDVVGEDAIYLSPVDAGQAENTATGGFVAPDKIDQEPHAQVSEHVYEQTYEQTHEQEQPHEQPHEEQGTQDSTNLPITTEAELEEKETAVLGAIDDDMQNMPLSQLQHQSPNQSLGTLDAQPASPKGKQVEKAPAESRKDHGSAIFSLNAPNGLVTIPIPPHYHKVRELLWFKKTIAESETAPEIQPAPRTPSPKKSHKKAPGTSRARRTQASKKTTSKAPADIEDSWSPPGSWSAKKAAEVAEAAAMQEASPAPRKTPIKKITLHFTRKPKFETDEGAAPEPEPEPEDESNQGSSGASGASGTRGVDEDEDADGDAEEEIMLP